MELKEKIEKANLEIEKNKILYNEEMKKYTTFKIGGKAECLIKIDNIKDLKSILKFVNENDIPLTVLGNGSNVLVSDKGIKGITIIIKIEKIDISEKNKKVEVSIGAGEKIGKLGVLFLKNEITGFEELSGIPGTIGGATRMNAGAHGREIKDIVKIVKCVDNKGNEKEFTNEQMEFGYRTSILKKEKYIVTEVEIELEKGNKEEIQSKMNEYAKYRKEKQPIEYPSAGSTFKRGKDFITAKLIDDAGLKGYSIGGAEVSKKHANFIINKGNATGKDIHDLILYVKETVKRETGVDLKIEQEFVNWE